MSGYQHHTKRPPKGAAAPPALSEAAFQQRIVDYCQIRGLLVFHDTDSRKNERGFPDLVIVGPTHTLFRELKTDKGRVRPDQEKWLLALKATGQDAGIWRPMHWQECVLPQLRALSGRTYRPGRS